MKKIERAILVILDSAGVGALPDAADYGDEGSNTLGSLAKATGGLNTPNMQKMGLGNIIDIEGVEKADNPIASYGKAAEKSVGKDTTVGHWELAGIIKEDPFPTYPNGFPKEIIDEFEEKTGRGTIGNCVASGTEVISRLGDEHVKTGRLIIYTSADSVFQIAAHEEIVSIDELYRYCEIAREMLQVGRIIARPFVGESGNYKRTANRHDYSMEPAEETVLDRLKAKGLDVIGVGKINDIFAGKGITEYVRSESNNDGMEKTIQFVKADNKGMIFTNLVDFDMHFGHRRDPEGYKQALEEFDKELGTLLSSLRDSDMLILSADHGCDPTFQGSDHTREYIPIIAYGQALQPVNLQIRDSFKDIADTIEEAITGINPGNSFYALMGQ